MTVLETAGVESEADLPYASAHRRAATRPSPTRRTPGGAGRRAVDRTRARPAGGRRSLRRRGRDARAARGSCRGGPALIVVDDLQWVDSASRDALSFAARRLTGSPAIFVAAQRAGAQPLPGLEVVPVGPLDRDDATRVLAENERRIAPEVLHEDPGRCPWESARARRAAPPADARPTRRDRGARRTRFRRRTASSAPSPPASRPSRAGGRLATVVAAADSSGTAGVVLGALGSLGIAEQDLGEVESLGSCCTSRRTGSSSVIHSFGPPPITAPTRPSGAVCTPLSQTADADPDRRAWHRAAATVGLDDTIADELDRAGARALARGRIRRGRGRP